MNKQTIQKVTPIITILILFILLMIVVRYEGNMIAQRDAMWYDILAKCKCACSNLALPYDVNSNKSLMQLGNLTLNFTDDASS